MPTHNDETLLERYQREALVDERIAADPTEKPRFRKAADWALNHLMKSS